MPIPNDPRYLSDEELERIADSDTPVAPDAHPGNVTAAGVNEKKGSTVIPEVTPVPSDSNTDDFLRGEGHHILNTALSLGEGLRSLPVAGPAYQKMGDIAARVFGFGEDPGIKEDPTFLGRTQDARTGLGVLAPPPPANSASKAGAVTGALTEALSTGAVSKALAIPEAPGFLLNAGRALLAGGREAAIAGATTAAQEGGITPDVGTSAALAGSIPVLGAASGATGNVLSKHLANTLLPTGAEATLAGGDAAKGLQDSGIIAGGAKSLMKKVQEYARKTTSDLDSFITSHKNGSKPLVDRVKLIDSINGEMAHFEQSSGATSDVFGGAGAGEKKAIIRQLTGLKNTIVRNYTSAKDRFLSPREALKIRREIDEMTAFGAEAEKTTASSALNEARQKLRTILNDEIAASVPGSEGLLKKSYNAMLALEGAKKLVDSPGLGKESFLVRRAGPLLLSAAGGAGTGLIASGGNPTAALLGLGAGAAMGMPGAATPLIQALKNDPQSTKYAEILARVFGISPEVVNGNVQGGPTQ